MRARSTLFTIFGDAVRPAGGEAWLRTLTGCMAALGFSPAATRTALHRMAAEGWVEPRRTGRYAAYRLTARGVDRLETAATRIYRLRAAAWDGRWRLLASPEARRDDGLVKALQWMGFGRLSAELWVSPHDHGGRLDEVLAEHGLDDAIRFTSEPAGQRGPQDADIVSRAWDLQRLRDAHRAFISQWSGQPAPARPEAAFTMRIRLVHHWRSFLFLDPGLPAALLPHDWLGAEAAACFADRYAAVDAAARRFYEALEAEAPGGAHAGIVRRGHDSPFAQGLRALETARPEPAQTAQRS